MTTLWEKVRRTMPGYREETESFKPRRPRRAKSKRDIEREVAETIRFERSGDPPKK